MDIEPLYRCKFCGCEYQPVRPEVCEGCGARVFERVLDENQCRLPVPLGGVGSSAVAYTSYADEAFVLVDDNRTIIPGFPIIKKRD